MVEMLVSAMHVVASESRCPATDFVDCKSGESPCHAWKFVISEIHIMQRICILKDQVVHMSANLAPYRFNVDISTRCD